jgi:hypothetical protein
MFAEEERLLAAARPGVVAWMQDRPREHRAMWERLHPKPKGMSQKEYDAHWRKEQSLVPPIELL